MNSTGFVNALVRNWKTLGGAAMIVFVVLLADLFVGAQQDAILREREAKIKRLEEQAFRLVSVDVRDITETRGISQTGRYAAVIRIDNVGEEPVYLSHPTVKAYIQTGTISWTEVSVGDMMTGRERQVYKIEKGSLLIRKTLAVPRSLPYNRHLIPKYMHVRFYITMFVLPESGFKEGEVVERKSDSYMYLKPYWVSEREIARVIDFGKTKVPTYMPISGFRNWNKAK
jgi:hypothetical protein